MSPRRGRACAGSASTSRASASCCACAGVRMWPPAPTTVVASVGQRVRPVERVHCRQRVLELRIFRAGPREQEVLVDRADEHVVLLGDECHLGAQRVERQVDEPDAPDLDAAAARRVNAREEAAECRLSGTGRPDHRDALSRLEVEVDPVQHVALRDVRVANALGDQALALRAVVGGRRGPAGRGRGRRAARTTSSPTWISSSHEISRSTGSASCTT